MSMTVGDSNYPAVLQNFFIHEGLAYRISPFNWKELGYYNNETGHPVDIERFYDNIMIHSLLLISLTACILN